MKEWISVKDRLPEDNETVLIFIAAYPGISMGKLFNGAFEDSIIRFDHDNPVTHWMPLPAEPDETKTTRCEHSGIEWDKDGKVVGVNP